MHASTERVSPAPPPNTYSDPAPPPIRIATLPPPIRIATLPPLYVSLAHLSVENSVEEGDQFVLVIKQHHQHLGQLVLKGDTHNYTCFPLYKMSESSWA